MGGSSFSKRDRERLERATSHCLLRDRRVLRRQLREAVRAGSPKLPEVIAERIAGSRAVAGARSNADFRLAYDDELPVARERGRVLAALEKHQVIVLCGETGSGKTTQLPKFCLELGRGIFGQIGHTQPRRIAARSVARRVAAELNTEVGDVVGYQTRFDRQFSENSRIKVMTDGILLAELRHDRYLESYDTLIIDEAHERSLNIDFLLGYLHKLLRKRRELKLVITSATLETDKFSRHFGNAPVLEISGRTYPIELEYLSADSEDADLSDLVSDAVDEILHKHVRRGDGDILVFLPGEREIGECRDQLRRRFSEGLEVLPLFGRLSAHDQDRVFGGRRRRRCILATNIAETSLTVPGVRFVIDSGLARISRYSVRNKVQQLPVEKISKASARQRAGRCGRMANGLCIRLFSEEDYLARGEHTPPEIMRTNLASVILEMSSLRLGEVEEFPFVDKPDSRFVRDGYRLLQELQAIDLQGRVTKTGREMARLPVDPRIARMLIAARETDSLPELRVVAAALSIPDPRQRSAENRQNADQRHAVFAEKESDFRTLLNLWVAWRDQQASGSRSALRNWCRENFLSYPRMREWQDLVHQLHALTRQAGERTLRPSPDYESLHRAILLGLLGHIGCRDEDGAYRGTRGRTFFIFPGSALKTSKAQWVMAAHLIETSRLFAHINARVKPAWIEASAGHLVKRDYHEPRWDAKAGRVMARETVTLYGLPLITARRTDFGRIDPYAARKIFILSALVDEKLGAEVEFLTANARTKAEIRDIEARLRRTDVLIDRGTLANLYASIIPAEVIDRPGLLRWLKNAPGVTRNQLHFDRQTLMQEQPESLEQFPGQLRVGANEIELVYEFDRDGERDGVTAMVPLPLLNQLPEHVFDYLVPGLIKEKIQAMLKGLPKRLRKQFVPVPDYTEALFQDLPDDKPRLSVWMANKLGNMSGAEITPADLEEVSLPEHLRMNFEIVDTGGAVCGTGRSLSELKAELGKQAQSSATAQATGHRGRENIKTWDFGRLAREIHEQREGRSLTIFPALEDAGDSVSMVFCDTPEQANSLSEQGVARLAWLALRQQVQLIQRSVRGRRSRLLGWRRHGDEPELVRQIFFHLASAAICRPDIPRSEATFSARLGRFRETLVPSAEELLGCVEQILEREIAVQTEMARLEKTPGAKPPADAGNQLEQLLGPDFVAGTEAAWLTRFPVYLEALELRLARLPREIAADQSLQGQLAPLQARWDELRRMAPEWSIRPSCREYRWLLEELRVSLFAQKLGTIRKVSVLRLDRFWRSEIARPLAEAGHTIGL